MSPFAMFMLLGGLAVGARRFLPKVRSERRWVEATSSLGLKWTGYTSLHGEIDGLRISVDLVRRTKGKLELDYTRVRAKAPTAATLLTIRGEDTWTMMQRFVGAGDVLVHDDDFDRRVHVQGDPAQVVSLLNADVRRLLVAFVENHEGSLEAGELCLEMKGIVSSRLQLESAVDAIRTLKTALDVHAWMIEERLAHNATHEVLAQVRRRNFSLLVERAPDVDLTRATATKLLDDADPVLRLAAARVLRDDMAFDAMSRLVRSTASTEHREAALAFLLEHWPYERCVPAVVAALRTGRPTLRIIAIEALVTNRDRSHLNLLARCSGMDDGALAEVATRSLGLLGDASYEPVMLDRLDHRSDAVKLAAIRSLGRLGSVAAVEPLLPLTTGLRTTGFIKEAARDAIRRIQARAGPVDSGRLSLVDEHESAGGLSVASESGSLAMVDEHPTEEDWGK